MRSAVQGCKVVHNLTGGGVRVMQLNLAEDEVQVLRDVLTDYLSDLRMEIVDTDQMDFRDKLKERKRVLEKVLGALSRGS